jgi:uncharacterized SAM-binding protein YcdF (DUF218 family)
LDILILLGNQNDSQGNLSPIAKSRCDLAVQLLQENEGLVVLPTGAFGPHFNTSDRPHGPYLTEYLIEKGISPDRILPHTDSSNTLEDARCARRVAVDSDAQKVIVVTSEFHMRRVRYIFGRVFQDIQVEFREARSPVDDVTMRSLIKHEARSLKRLQTEWVDIPL